MTEEKESRQVKITVKKKMRFRWMMLLGHVLSVHEGVFEEYSAWLLTDLEKNLGKYFKYTVK